MSDDAPLSAYDELMARHAKELRELQSSCPHEVLSPWMGVMDIHYNATSMESQECAQCRAEIHRRAPCWQCRKMLNDDEIHDGQEYWAVDAELNGQKVRVGGPMGFYCSIEHANVVFHEQWPDIKASLSPRPK
jgi:hypothetical protein